MASVRQTRELREYHDALAAQQWRERIAAASLAERGRHELALEKQKEQRREKRKDRWAIAVYLATNLDRHVVTPAGKVVLEALAAPFMLVRWMWAQLFGKA